MVSSTSSIELPTPVAVVEAESSPAPVPVAEEKVAAAEEIKSEDPVVVSAEVSAVPELQVTKSRSLSGASDSDFVIVTHADANVTVPTVVSPSPAQIIAPVLPRPLSFASAAARGAQVPTPEKVRKVVPVQTKKVAVEVEDKDGGVSKKEKKGKGGKVGGGDRREPRGNQTAQAVQQQQPVAVKA